MYMIFTNIHRGHSINRPMMGNPHKVAKVNTYEEAAAAADLIRRSGYRVHEISKCWGTAPAASVAEQLGL